MSEILQGSTKFIQVFQPKEISEEPGVIALCRPFGPDALFTNLSYCSAPCSLQYRVHAEPHQCLIGFYGLDGLFIFCAVVGTYLVQLSWLVAFECYGILTVPVHKILRLSQILCNVDNLTKGYFLFRCRECA